MKAEHEKKCEWQKCDFIIRSEDHRKKHMVVRHGDCGSLLWVADTIQSNVDKIISEVTEGKRGSAYKALKRLATVRDDNQGGFDIYRILKKTFPLNSQLKYLLITFPLLARNSNPSTNQSLLLI